jgi:hypothetical protein
MAIQIELAYSKKLGLPEYSSHQFSVTLRRELTSLDAVDAEVERGYAQLQAAVDRQIADPGFVPGGGHETPRLNLDGPNIEWRCSEKQRNLIDKIITEKGIGRDDVDALAAERFGHGLAQLNKLEASGLIDELFQRYGRNGHGRRRPYSQRAA